MIDREPSCVATAVLACITAACIAAAPAGLAQTREQGPWWPSVHGPADQAGASNFVTPEKILSALQIPRTGQTYELGHMYEASMPQYGYRPYFLQAVPAAPPARAGEGVAQRDYFAGVIGQMGTQFDALGHQGETVMMADGSLQNVYYNGFTQEELTGTNQGLHGLEALGTEQVKPFITRGILIDIAGYKGVESLTAGYEVTMDDVRGALARQNMDEETVQQGDAVLFNYGWAVNWTNPSKYNDSYVGVGENEGSPGIYAEVTRWLISRRVALVGADSCCVEVRPRPGTENVHRMLFLQDGIPLLENMELRELAGDEAYEFLFLALTERIKGATGSPVRPIAVR